MLKALQKYHFFHIFKLSMNTSSVHKYLKPLLKKGDKAEPGHFKPVSISIVSKLLEMVIYVQTKIY